MQCYYLRNWNMKELNSVEGKSVFKNKLLTVFPVVWLSLFAQVNFWRTTRRLIQTGWHFNRSFGEYCVLLQICGKSLKILTENILKVCWKTYATTLTSFWICHFVVTFNLLPEVIFTWKLFFCKEIVAVLTNALGFTTFKVHDIQRTAGKFVIAFFFKRFNVTKGERWWWCTGVITETFTIQRIQVCWHPGSWV